MLHGLAKTPNQNPKLVLQTFCELKEVKEKMEFRITYTVVPAAVAVTLCYSRLFPSLAMTPPEGMEKTLKLITERQS